MMWFIFRQYIKLQVNLHKVKSKLNQNSQTLLDSNQLKSLFNAKLSVQQTDFKKDLIILFHYFTGYKLYCKLSMLGIGIQQF